jgi:hypothetical protein
LLKANDAAAEIKAEADQLRERARQDREKAGKVLADARNEARRIEDEARAKAKAAFQAEIDAIKARL